MNVLSQPHAGNKVGGVFDTVLGAGLSVGLPLIQGAVNKPKTPKIPLGCTLVNVSGHGEIALCLDQIWAQYQSLSDADKLLAAGGFNDLLNDAAKFNQASTNEYFVNTKKFFADQAGKAAQAVQTNTNPVTEVLQGEVIAGVPNLYLIGGGLILGYFMLSRGK